MARFGKARRGETCCDMAGHVEMGRVMSDSARTSERRRMIHPATFSKAIIDVLDEHLPSSGVVLDPFAGVGTIHKLATSTRITIGIEIEPEWARLHEDTIEADALVVLREMEAASVDAIATSPTFGNRMADHHNASDDSERLTYKHVLGRDLHPANSGAMQWGTAYRKLHGDAWRLCVRVLRPSGIFALNIKNHVRGGVVQRVAEWHIETLHDLGLRCEVVEAVPTAGLNAGSNSAVRTSHEFVLVFRKPPR